jgi:predicted phosphodiesterase
MIDIWLLSDLHHDFEAFAWPKPPKHDLLVVAGDARDELHRSLRWVRASAPTEKPILYVPGNHDAWDCNWPQGLVAARSIAADLGIHLLAEGEACVINGVRFCGATLWTDFRLRPEEETTTCTKHDEGGCHDNRRIRVSGHDPRQWLAQDAIRTHFSHRTAIERWLGEPCDGPSVVVTHHAPHERSLPHGEWQHHCDGTYASDLTGLLVAETAPDLWLHGHTHTSRDYTVGRTRIVANARGYRNQNPNFNAALTVEV